MLLMFGLFCFVLLCWLACGNMNHENDQYRLTPLSTIVFLQLMMDFASSRSVSSRSVSFPSWYHWQVMDCGDNSNNPNPTRHGVIHVTVCGQGQTEYCHPFE